MTDDARDRIWRPGAGATGADAADRAAADRAAADRAAVSPASANRAAANRAAADGAAANEAAASGAADSRAAAGGGAAPREATAGGASAAEQAVDSTPDPVPLGQNTPGPITPNPVPPGPYTPSTITPDSITPIQAIPDPYGLPFAGRRIEPSPPPDRRGLLRGLLIGLLAGLVIFGAVGWIMGRLTAPNAKDRTAASPAAAASPATADSTARAALGVFERNQRELNRPRFAGTGLETIAEGWLPFLNTCSRSRGGGAGERARLRCTVDGMSAIFVAYDSVADRDRARARTVGNVVDAGELAPGIGPAGQRATPSGRTNGSYVEYAYRLTESGVTRTVSAIWWDDAATPVAGHLLAYWADGVGERWEPIRDVWARYA